MVWVRVWVKGTDWVRVRGKGRGRGRCSGRYRVRSL